jgi:putative transposase
MVKNRAYKFRLYPNAEQRTYFARAFGSVRFLYNRMLADRIVLYEKYKDDKEALKQHKPRTYSDYKKEYDWLYEIDNLALANTQINVQSAYRNFFRDKSVGFPKFKSKHSGHNSYTTNNQGGNIRIENKHVKLPKIGFVRLVQHRQIPTSHKIKSCTISLAPSGKYYVSILTEYETEQPTPTLDKSKALGLDYSSPSFYVDSQGEEAGRPRFYREAEDRLAREQRKLSHMQKGSANYRKQKRKVARAHEHVANQRKDWIHKKSKRLADTWDYICVEDVNLRGIAGALRLGKSTNDNGFGAFRTVLAYKMEDRGKKFIKIDKWFPSSKTCHDCGNVYKELVLGESTWICPECGAYHLRDYNAALNIRDEGLRMLSVA